MEQASANTTPPWRLDEDNRPSKKHKGEGSRQTHAPHFTASSQQPPLSPLSHSSSSSSHFQTPSLTGPAQFAPSVIRWPGLSPLRDYTASQLDPSIIETSAATSVQAATDSVGSYLPKSLHAGQMADEASSSSFKRAISDTGKQPVDDDEQYARYLQDQLNAESNQVESDAQLARKLSLTYKSDEQLREGVMDDELDWNAELYKPKIEYDSLPNHLKHNHHYRDDPDYLYALQLQNDFDSSTMAADDEDMVMGGTSPVEEAGEPANYSKHFFGGSSDESTAKDKVTGNEATPDEAVEFAANPDNTIEDTAATPKAPTIPEADLLSLPLPGDVDHRALRDLPCTSCSDKCFKSTDDVIKLVSTWHDEKLHKTGYSFDCVTCHRPICVGCFGAQGCSPETPRGKPAASSEPDRKLKHRPRNSHGHNTVPLIPSWNCHNAPIQMMWFVLVHLDFQLAKQESSRTVAAKRPARRRGAGPKGVGYGAAFYDEWAEDYHAPYDSDHSADWKSEGDSISASPAPLPLNPMTAAPPSQNYLDLLSMDKPSSKLKQNQEPPSSTSKGFKKHYQNLKAQVGLGPSSSKGSQAPNAPSASPTKHKKLTDLHADKGSTTNYANLPPELTKVSQSWAKFEKSHAYFGSGSSPYSHSPGNAPPAPQKALAESPAGIKTVPGSQSWRLDKYAHSKPYAKSSTSPALSASATLDSFKENFKASTSNAESLALSQEAAKTISPTGNAVDPADAINARNHEWNPMPLTTPPAPQNPPESDASQLYLHQQQSHSWYFRPSMIPSFNTHMGKTSQASHTHYQQPTEAFLAKTTDSYDYQHFPSAKHSPRKHAFQAKASAKSQGSIPGETSPSAQDLDAMLKLSQAEPPSLSSTKSTFWHTGSSVAPPHSSFYDDDNHYPDYSYYSRYGRRGLRKDKERETFEAARKEKDELSRQSLSRLCGLLTSEELRVASVSAANDQSSTQELSQAMGQRVANMIRRSTCIDHLAELLRGTLQDVQDRRDLYNVILQLLQNLATPATAQLLVTPRPHKRASLLLHPTPEDAANYTVEGDILSIRGCMADLVRQCKIYLQRKVDASSRKNLDPFCQSMVALSASLDDMQDTPQPSQTPTSSIQDHKALWDAYHKEHAFEELPDELMIQNHSFGKQAISSSQPPAKGRMKRLIEEGANLTTSLPLGIFVRYAESRPDIMKALIIGPAGTPYSGGMFEFDFWADPRYPTTPPKCQFVTTGGGRAHFNPNLYNNGKVCLSLLGTWSGEPWRADQSTILQILVSLQAMVLTSEPWYNEPGRESDYARQQKQSKDYNKEVQQLTVKWAMENVLRKDQEAKAAERKTPWADVIQHYIANNAIELTQTVNDWARFNKQCAKDAEEFLQRMTGFV